MNEQEQRIFIRFLAKVLKRTSKELIVHKIFAETLRSEGHSDVDEIFNRIRDEPSLLEQHLQQFAWLDELLPPTETEIVELEFLARWLPSGLPN